MFFIYVYLILFKEITNQELMELILLLVRNNIIYIYILSLINILGNRNFSKEFTKYNLKLDSKN